MLSEALSFVLAAVWVSLATVAAERLGTKVGGVVTTLPSTLVVALLFMAVEEGAPFAADVAAVVPAEMGINAVFLAIFMVASSRGLPVALAAALGGWTVLSAALYYAHPEGLLLPLVLFVVLVAATSLYLKYRHRFEKRGGQHISYTPRELAFRGLFAGLMISVSVVAASMGGPVIGGILSVFPAIFTSTMVILYLRQGREFTGATGSVMILGSANVVCYSVVVVYAFPPFGAAWGTLVALAVSFGWSFGLYVLVQRFMR